MCIGPFGRGAPFAGFCHIMYCLPFFAKFCLQCLNMGKMKVKKTDAGE